MVLMRSISQQAAAELIALLLKGPLGPFFIMHSIKDISLKPIWIFIGAFLWAVTWILPNHAYPWTSFLAEANSALVICLVGIAIIAKCKYVINITNIVLILLFVSLIPVVQYLLGILPYAGQAWMAFFYMFGFTLAVCIGQQEVRNNSTILLQIMCGALIIAALFSALIQIGQWSGVGHSTGWLSLWLSPSSSQRPSANIGQPNQLASLHLWGILSVILLFSLKLLTRKFGIFLCLILVLGLALTQSRAGILGFSFTIIFLWIMQVKKIIKLNKFDILLIGIIFLIALLGHSILAREMLLDGDLSIIERSAGEMRIRGWMLFLDAILQRPWLGYGWYEVMPAQLAVAERHLDMHALFAQSHNLIIDIFIWIGIPLGFTIVTLMAFFLSKSLGLLSGAVNWIVMAMLVTITIHAMVEFPLHYGYFLWPAGILLGSLDRKTNSKAVVFSCSKTPTLIGLVSCLIFTLLVIRDYLPIEEAVMDTRIEQNRVLGPEVKVPDVLILDQLQTQLWMLQFKPYQGMSRSELAKVETITRTYPSVQFVMKYIVALAINDNILEAQRWMFILNSIGYVSWQIPLSKHWEVLQGIYPQLEHIEWLPPTDR